MSWTRTFRKEELRRMVKVTNKSSSLLNLQEGDIPVTQDRRMLSPKFTKNNKSSRHSEQSFLPDTPGSKLLVPENLDTVPLEMQLKYALRPITNPTQKFELLKKKVEEAEESRRQEEEEEETKKPLSLPPINVSNASISQRSIISNKHTDATPDVSRRHISLLNGSTNDSIIYDPRSSDKRSSFRRSQPTLITAPKLDPALYRKKISSHKKSLSMLSHDLNDQVQQLKASLNINLSDIKPKKNITSKIHELGDDVLDGAKEAKLIIDSRRPSSSEEEDIQLDNLDKKGLEKLLETFKNPEKDPRDKKKRHNPLEKFTQSVERNAILNDFRPKKSPKKKEYYNRWYIPVEHWTTEKLKAPTARKRDLMLKDDLYIFKNLHNYDRVEEKNPFEKARRRNEYEYRYEVVQDRLTQNPMAGIFKAELMKKGKRVPEFLKHTPLPVAQMNEIRKNFQTESSKLKSEMRTKESEHQVPVPDLQTK